MSLSLDQIIALGETGTAAILDVVSDVKAGIAAQGGVASVAVAVAEALMADAKFKSDLAALVVALKAL